MSMTQKVYRRGDRYPLHTSPPFTQFIRYPSTMNNSINESFHLSEISSHSEDNALSPHEIEQPVLAQPDGGKAAWLTLVSCCLIQVPVWGVPHVQHPKG